MVLGQQLWSIVSYHTEKYLHYTSEINLDLEFHILGSGIQENSLDPNLLDGHESVKDSVKNYSGTWLMIYINSKPSPQQVKSMTKKHGFTETVKCTGPS